MSYAVFTTKVPPIPQARVPALRKGRVQWLQFGSIQNKSSWHSTTRSHWKETPGKRGLSINDEELQIHEYRKRRLLH
jgi:hypothetical protein